MLFSFYNTVQAALCRDVTLPDRGVRLRFQLRRDTVKPLTI